MWSKLYVLQDTVPQGWKGTMGKFIITMNHRAFYLIGIDVICDEIKIYIIQQNPQYIFKLLRQQKTTF